MIALTSTHNRATEGHGRKLHLSHDGATTLCGIPESRGHLLSDPGAVIPDLAAWLALDVDGEVCGTCAHRARTPQSRPDFAPSPDPA